ncbi:hypothetical protein FJZ31_06990 [Candidatus Poribacteria bacterium]|nr:hypothetical protein [Candidatus Poribacteria bacterium]
MFLIPKSEIRIPNSVSPDGYCPLSQFERPGLLIVDCSRIVDCRLMIEVAYQSTINNHQSSILR